MAAMKSCLVTGASGFIGQHLTRTLHRHGYQVVGVGRKKEPPAEISDVLSKWIACNLSDHDAAEHIVQKAGAVNYLFHLAATVKDTLDVFELQDIYPSDVITPVRLADQLAGTLRHVCFFSSVAVYGSSMEAEITESTPIKPDGVYGTNKAVLEDALDFFSRKYSIPLSILRISSVYGPGMPSNRAIPRFITGLRNGEQLLIKADPRAKRNYVYVEDLPVAAIAAVQQDSSGIYNIASDSPKSLMEIGLLLGHLMGHPFQPEIRDSIPGKDHIINIDKARAELGFQPRPPESGLKDMLERDARLKG